MVCSTTTRLAAEGERASAHWVALTGRLQALRRGESLPGESIEDGFGGLSLLTELSLPVDLIAEAGTVISVPARTRRPSPATSRCPSKPSVRHAGVE